MVMAACVYANFNNHNIELIHSFNEKSWMYQYIHLLPVFVQKGTEYTKSLG